MAAPPRTGSPRDVPLGTPERPAWRGRLHQWAVVAMIPYALALIWVTSGASRRFGAIVYTIGIAAMFATSCTYHRLVHDLRVRSILRRADHAVIYVAIAATYTPVCIVAMPARWGVPFLIGVWSAAIIGMAAKVAMWDRARVFGAILYISLGWVAVIALPTLVIHAGWLVTALFIIGGLCYTVGAIGFACKWPRLRPEVFGYHEVWHVWTVLAASIHMVAVWLVLT